MNVVTSKLNERTTNVFENKRTLWEASGRSGNLSENKDAYLQEREYY